MGAYDGYPPSEYLGQTFKRLHYKQGHSMEKSSTVVQGSDDTHFMCYSWPQYRYWLGNTGPEVGMLVEHHGDQICVAAFR